MPKFNVHPKKEMPKNQRVEPAEANEKDAKDLGYTDSAGRATRAEPTRDPHSIGSSIVRRYEPDDED